MQVGADTQQAGIERLCTSLEQCRHRLCCWCGLQHTLTLAPCCRRRWRVKLYRQAPRKVAAHTAMSDIKESLKELQYYKHVLFRGK